MLNKAFIACSTFLIGCSGLKSYNSTDTGLNENDRRTGDEDGVESSDDADDPESIQYPSDTQSSILLYTGHGGAVSRGPTGRGGFNVISDHWSGLGWTTDVLETFPETSALGEYRMVGLMAPGFSDTVAFTELDIIKLESLIQAGTRVVVFAEENACDNPHLNTLLAALDVSIRFTGEGMGLNSIVYDAEITENQQLTHEVNAIRFTDPCYLDASDATVLASRRHGDQNRVFMAVERPGQAGDVVVMGDFQILDDSGVLLQENNLTLSENLASVLPE